MGDGAGRWDGEGGAGRAKEFGVTAGCGRALARAASSRFAPRPCRAAIPDAGLVGVLSAARARICWYGGHGAQTTIHGAAHPFGDVGFVPALVG